MADFDQDLRLNGARLIQQPLFDEDAQLVPPWKAPFVFRKGALVAVEAHLTVYHFMGDEKPNHVSFPPCTPICDVLIFWAALPDAPRSAQEGGRIS